MTNEVPMNRPEHTARMIPTALYVLEVEVEEEDDDDVEFRAYS